VVVVADSVVVTLAVVEALVVDAELVGAGVLVLVLLEVVGVV